MLLCSSAAVQAEPAATQDQGQAVVREAERDAANVLWSRIEALKKSPEPRLADEESRVTQAFIEALAQRSQNLSDMLMEFVEKYPDDSRHWDAVLELTQVERRVVKEFGNVSVEGWDAVTEDEEAERAWKARVNAHVERMMAAKDVQSDKMQSAYVAWVSAGFQSRSAILAEFRRRLDVLREKFPSSPERANFESNYLENLRREDASAVLPHLTKLSQDANASVASWAQGQVNRERLRQTPMELTFTALDGRKVDLAKLRGKVVLIDFWATWCGPCIDELPNVKKVYEKFRPSGFEVISVSVDEPKNRKKLIDLIAEHNLPWPQQFDGVNKRNKIAETYGINGLPTTFLLDKSGRLAETELRGEKDLEAAVKRLLASD